MNRTMDRSVQMLVMVLLVGCGTPETRWLSCSPRPARDEIASFKYHDPFPDEDAGPKTYNRPRAFLEPRSDSQKSFDLRYIKAAYGYPQHKYAWDPNAIPIGANQYPVQPVWQTPSTTAPVAVLPGQ